MRIRSQSGHEDGDGPVEASLPLWLRGILSILILAGVALRLAWPDVTVFLLDQAEACAMAEDIVHGHWQTAGLFNTGLFRNPPAYPYLLAAVWRCCASPAALVWFTMLANVAALAGAAALVHRWCGSATAWWATALLATSFWAITHSRWVWAQDLLFPASTAVCVFLWLWVDRGRDWAAMGVIVCLALVVHIHLGGVILCIAVAVYVLWSRPRFEPWPLALGVLLAAASFYPYVADGHLAFPRGSRLGYAQAWRVPVGAAMSVTGLGWQWLLEGAAPRFARSLVWRRWLYEGAMLVPVGLLGVGLLFAARRVWRDTKAARAARRNPLSMASALILLIPLIFIVLGIRVSPTHFTLWYPLPFVLAGWVMARASQRKVAAIGPGLLTGLVLGSMVAQLAFFSEQLAWLREHGGAVEARAGRLYGAVQRDLATLVPLVRAREVWLSYEGPPEWQTVAAAYLLRHAAWPEATSDRAVVHFRWGQDAARYRAAVQFLPPGAAAPPGAYQVRPWTGPQCRNGRIPRLPSPD